MFKKTMRMMEGEEHRRALFEEMMTQQRRVSFEGEEGLLQPRKEKSLWMLFLDAI